MRKQLFDRRSMFARGAALAALLLAGAAEAGPWCSDRDLSGRWRLSANGWMAETGEPTQPVQLDCNLRLTRAGLVRDLVCLDESWTSWAIDAADAWEWEMDSRASVDRDCRFELDLSDAVGDGIWFDGQMTRDGQLVAGTGLERDNPAYYNFTLVRRP